MDASFWAFKDELADLPQEEQDALWAEILNEDYDDDDDGHDQDSMRPPKGLRTSTAVVKAARKQFTDLVSPSISISHYRSLTSFVGNRILPYDRCPYFRGCPVYR